MLRTYFKKLCEITLRGDAREESYYSTLEHLLQTYSESTGSQKTSITTLPLEKEKSPFGFFNIVSFLHQLNQSS